MRKAFVKCLWQALQIHYLSPSVMYFFLISRLRHNFKIKVAMQIISKEYNFHQYFLYNDLSTDLFNKRKVFVMNDQYQKW